MKPVVIYPRGFLGYDIGLPVQRSSTDVTKLMSMMRYNKASISRDRTVISNSDIEKLHDQLTQGDRSSRSFEFREKVLKAAMIAFGTNSFYDWCMLQKDSPYLTDMHRRFLNDTFMFIYKGERTMNVRVWNQVIAVREAQTEDNRVDYLYREFFKMDESALFRRPFTMTNAISSWTSQPGVIEDLLSTLRILFGDTKHLH